MQSTLASPITPAVEPPAFVEPQLVLEGVSRSFGRTLALAPISLHLGRGSICRVIGNNGSGKSTLLRIAAGVLRPSTGRRWAAGTALYLQPGDGARRPQTVRQAIEFVARVRGGSTASDEALATVGLTELADAPIGELSSGQRNRVSLAIVLVCRPSVACLDELTAHLDTPGSVSATDVVAALAARGSAVLAATHDDGFLAGLADTSIRLGRGRLRTGKGWRPAMTLTSPAPRRSGNVHLSIATPVAKCFSGPPDASS